MQGLLRHHAPHCCTGNTDQSSSSWLLYLSRFLVSCLYSIRKLHFFWPLKPNVCWRNTSSWFLFVRVSNLHNKGNSEQESAWCVLTIETKCLSAVFILPNQSKSRVSALWHGTKFCWKSCRQCSDPGCLTKRTSLQLYCRPCDSKSNPLGQTSFPYFCSHEGEKEFLCDVLTRLNDCYLCVQPSLWNLTTCLETLSLVSQKEHPESLPKMFLTPVHKMSTDSNQWAVMQQGLQCTIDALLQRCDKWNCEIKWSQEGIPCCSLLRIRAAVSNVIVTVARPLNQVSILEWPPKWQRDRAGTVRWDSHLQDRTNNSHISGVPVS